jgi:hypothetical protein
MLHPPSWWESQADAEWRREVWANFPSQYKAQLLGDGASQAEIYIHCCGKRRLTVGQVCPECGRRPF